MSGAMIFLTASVCISKRQHLLFMQTNFSFETDMLMYVSKLLVFWGELPFSFVTVISNNSHSGYHNCQFTSKHQVVTNTCMVLSTNQYMTWTCSIWQHVTNSLRIHKKGIVLTDVQHPHRVSLQYKNKIIKRNCKRLEHKKLCQIILSIQRSDDKYTRRGLPDGPYRESLTMRPSMMRRGPQEHNGIETQHKTRVYTFTLRDYIFFCLLFL